MKMKNKTNEHKKTESSVKNEEKHINAETHTLTNTTAQLNTILKKIYIRKRPVEWEKIKKFQMSRQSIMYETKKFPNYQGSFCVDCLLLDRRPDLNGLYTWCILNIILFWNYIHHHIYHLNC